MRVGAVRVIADHLGRYAKGVARIVGRHRDRTRGELLRIVDDEGARCRVHANCRAHRQRIGCLVALTEAASNHSDRALEQRSLHVQLPVAAQLLGEAAQDVEVRGFADEVADRLKGATTRA